MKEFKFEIGDTVTANVYSKIGIGEILERERDDITALNHYYVEFLFVNNGLNRMWIYEDNLLKVSTHFKELCDQFHIDIYEALHVLHNNPELTDEQVIIYFRPDCYINMFGELVNAERGKNEKAEKN